MDIYELMKQVNEWVKEILQDNYVGVYFQVVSRVMRKFNLQTPAE